MISLEKLGDNNVADIHRLQKRIFEKLYTKYKDEGSPFVETKSSLLEKMKRSNNHFYYIKNSEEIIGFVRIVADDNQKKAKIGPIGITPENEGRGYGSEAMLFIEKNFPTVQEWYVDTILQEKRLVHFYKKLGYQETGQIENIQEGMAIIYFEKNSSVRIE